MARLKSAILNQFGKNLDITTDNLIGKYYRQECVIESSLSSELWKLQHENISHNYTYLLQEQELRLIQQSCPAVGNHRESACNRCVQSFDCSL